jgi:TolB-like protein
MTAIGSTGQPGQDVTPANRDGSRDCSKDSVAVAPFVNCASQQQREAASSVTQGQIESHKGMRLASWSEYAITAFVD